MKIPLHICRSQLLLAQEQAALQIEKLLQMNVLVKQLRSEHVAAKAALAAAVASAQPQNIALARAWLQSVIQRKKITEIAQKTLLHHAEQGMNRSIINAVGKIKATLAKMNANSELWHIQINIRPRQIFTLAVVPDTADGTPAVYSYSKNFIQEQTLQINWQQQIRWKGSWAPKWMNNIVKNNSCAATIEKGRHKSQAVLIVAKHLLNLY